MAMLVSSEVFFELQMEMQKHQRHEQQPTEMKEIETEMRFNSHYCTLQSDIQQFAQSLQD